MKPRDIGDIESHEASPLPTGEVGLIDRKEIRKQAEREARVSTREEIRRMWRVVGLSVGGLILLAFAVMGAVILTKGLMKKGEHNLTPVHKADVAQMVDEASKTARGYLAAKSAEERAQFVFDRQRVLPLMSQDPAAAVADPRKLQTLSTPQYHVARGREFLIALAEFDQAPPQMWIFEKAQSGELLLHWEVLTRQSDMPWEEFLRARPTTPKKMRVTLGPADYYNFAFADPATFLCFEVQQGPEGAPVFGYLRKDSPSYEKLKTVQMMADVNALPVIAELAFPANASSTDQVSIEKILAFSWVDGVDM